MGSVVKAICECGYEKKIAIGGGRLNFKTVEYFPCLCKTCREVVPVNLKSNAPICPECNSSDNLPFNNKTLIMDKGKDVISRSFDNVLTDGIYKCPCSKNGKLKFFDTGLIWD